MTKCGVLVYNTSMNTRQQGSVGVAAAIHYFVSKGYAVSIPLSEVQRYDLVVDDGKLNRIECKTTRYKNPDNYYLVGLKTCGGNQSGAGTSKKLNQADCDLVFIKCEDNTHYVIPSDQLHGKSTLQLSPKWDKFKVE